MKRFYISLIAASAMLFACGGAPETKKEEATTPKVETVAKTTEAEHAPEVAPVATEGTEAVVTEGTEAVVTEGTDAVVEKVEEVVVEGTEKAVEKTEEAAHDAHTGH